MVLMMLLAAVAAYGLQNVLMAALFRRYEVSALVAMRGLTLAVVMSPLLLFSQPSDWRQLIGGSAQLGSYVIPVSLIAVAACLTAMLANISQAIAVRHLPVGVAYALCMVTNALGGVAIGLGFFNESMSLMTAWCGAGVVVCSVLLALQSRQAANQSSGGKGDNKENDERQADLASHNFKAQPWRGVLAAVSFGCCFAVSGATLSVLTRATSPFFAAWAWEAGIGVVMIAICLGKIVLSPRGERSSGKAEGVLSNHRLWIRVAWSAAPTLIGTGCYAYAVGAGALSLAATVTTAVMVSSALFAWLLYREHLRPVQWVFILLTMLALIALALSRSGA